MSRRGWLGVLAGCLASLLLIPTAWALTRPDTSGVGQLPTASLPTASTPAATPIASPGGTPTPRPTASIPAAKSTAGGSAASLPSARPTLDPSAPAIPIYQANIAAQPKLGVRAATPVALRIEAIGVAAAVEAVGVSKDGSVEIPEADRVGWYQYGSAPGDPTGSAVIVGHRDSRTLGRGVLFDLGAVKLGEQIKVRMSSGETLNYRVVERRSYAKQGLPWATFFTDRGTPRLTVITCGGAYDADNGGYQDNIIVTAVPA